jgi:succinate dehydrogenase/fumarate reductase-like Fe-S protein
LIEGGQEPIAFDHDCREGICGICSLMISGVAHGPERATTACQLHMRHFKDGDTVTIEAAEYTVMDVRRSEFGDELTVRLSKN